MQLSEIRATVKSIITDKLGVNESEVTPNACFINDLRVYSLDLSELFKEFEKKFNISIPDEDLEKFKTIDDVVTYIYDIK